MYGVHDYNLQRRKTGRLYAAYQAPLGMHSGRLGVGCLGHTVQVKPPRMVIGQAEMHCWSCLRVVKGELLDCGGHTAIAWQGLEMQ